MRTQIGLIAAAGLLVAGSAKAASVEINDAVVRITVIPEARSDVRVEVARSNGRLPLTVTNVAGRTLIQGQVRRGLRGRCPDLPEGRPISVARVGNVAWNDIPQVVIRTPRSVSISTNGTVAGVIARSDGLELNNSRCTRWTIADVAGPVSIRESGASVVRMGSAERLDLGLTGASQVNATRVNDANLRLSGAGQVRIHRVNGELEANVSGAGQIHVAGGRATHMRAGVSGVGQVHFGGVADSLDARISGLGGVRVAEVRGPVRKSVSGAGSVSVGRQVAER